MKHNELGFDGCTCEVSGKENCEHHASAFFMREIHTHLTKLKSKPYVQYLALPSVSGMARAGVGTLAGWTIEETTGVAPLNIRLRDGTDINAPIIAIIKVLANDSKTQWLLPVGVEYAQGLFFELVSGSFSGNAYILN
jgi:hypothetical protein